MMAPNNLVPGKSQSKKAATKTMKEGSIRVRNDSKRIQRKINVPESLWPVLDLLAEPNGGNWSGTMTQILNLLHRGNYTALIAIADSAFNRTSQPLAIPSVSIPQQIVTASSEEQTSSPNNDDPFLDYQF